MVNGIYTKVFWNVIKLNSLNGKESLLSFWQKLWRMTRIRFRAFPDARRF